VALNCIGLRESVQFHRNDPKYSSQTSLNSNHSNPNQSPFNDNNLKVASQAEMLLGFYDADTQNKIRQLEIDKQIAVNNENFELAKHLKVQIDKLKAVGIQLQNLEA